jgi:ubiquinone biosynthesis protein UbiJ
MLQGPITQLLQHLINQNSWAHALLQPFAGKSVRLDFLLAKATLVILENGNLAVAGETNIPDATVTIPPGLLLRLIAKDESAKMQIRVEGDTHLASELSKVFSNIRWDYEDDLSKVVGDIPASKLGQFLRKSTSTVKATGTNLSEMLFEYWQEEKPMIAKKRHVEQFNQAVDILRADVDRLEKRFDKLMQQPSNPHSDQS